MVFGLSPFFPANVGMGYVEFLFASWNASMIAFLKAAIGSASSPSAIMTVGGPCTMVGGTTGM